MDLLLLLLESLFQQPNTPPLPSPPAQAQPVGPVGADGIIGLEGRKLLPEFTIPGAPDQAAMRVSLGATQRLSCGASASLIYRSDVIIFSSHQVLHADGSPEPDLAHCVFKVARDKDGGVTEESYPLLLDTLDHGLYGVDNAAAMDVWNRDNQRDWAIARLARPVAGIEPYRLPEHAPLGEPGDVVTTVSETTENWKGSSQNTDRLAQTCRVVPVEPGFSALYPAVIHLDCDVGRGASGGALVADAASARPVYVGTTIAYTGNRCAEAGLETCFSIARRVDADLAARIMGTTAMRAGPGDEALAAAQRARLEGGRARVAAEAAELLSAPFPVRDDAAGREIASLRQRIRSLEGEGRVAQTNPLFLDAFRALHDPDQTRPEWPRLMIENGEAMLLEDRPVDAYGCFHAALAVAPEALKPYLELRMAQTAADPVEKQTHVRAAYLAGGEALFRLAKADGELAQIRVGGIPTVPDSDE